MRSQLRALSPSLVLVLGMMSTARAGFVPIDVPGASFTQAGGSTTPTSPKTSVMRH